MSGPKFCASRWTILTDIAVFVARSALSLFAIPIERPLLLLNPTFAESSLRAVGEAAPRIPALFFGFQRLVHIFFEDMTPAASILSTFSVRDMRAR
jgi:hypothetical protein